MGGNLLVCLFFLQDQWYLTRDCITEELFSAFSINQHQSINLWQRVGNLELLSLSWYFLVYVDGPNLAQIITVLYTLTLVLSYPLRENGLVCSFKSPEVLKGTGFPKPQKPAWIQVLATVLVDSKELWFQDFKRWSGRMLQRTWTYHEICASVGLDAGWRFNHSK